MKLLVLAVLVLVTACKSKEELVADYVVSANEYLALKDYQTARIEFTNALKIDEFNVEALLGLSELYEKENKYPDLYRTLHKILEIQPKHKGARRKLLDIYVYVNQFEKALNESNLLLSQEPDSVEVKVIRASIFFRSGNYSQGIAEAKAILDIQPNNIHAKYMLATYMLQQNKHSDALDMLNTALEHSPENINLNQLKIYILNAQGNIEQATAVLATLVERLPSNGVLQKQLANQYLKIGEDLKAEKTLRKFSDREKSPNANLTLVEYFLAKKQKKQAEIELTRFINEFPGQVELQFTYIELLVADKRTKEAKAQLQSIVQTKNTKNQLKAKNILAWLALQDNNFEKQRQLYAEVVKEDPQNVTALIGIAKQDLREDKVEQAINSLREILSFAPRSAVVFLALGQAHEIHGDQNLAQDYYATALRRGSNNPTIVAEYSRFLIKQGNTKLAEKTLESAIRNRIVNKAILGLLAQSKLNLQKWDEAQRIADQLESVATESTIVSQIRGHAHMGKSEHSESIAFFKDVQQATPNSAKPLAALIGAYLRAGENAKAMAFLDNTLKQQPNNQQAQLLKGAVFELENKLTEAEQAYKKALAMDKANLVIYRYLTRILLVQNKTQEALSIISNSRRALTGDLNLAITEAVLNERLGKVEEAAAIYRDLLKQGEATDIAANNLAVLLLDSGESAALEEAKTLAERFRDSTIPQFQDTLGWVYLKTGNKIEALYLLEKASKALTEVAEVRYHLGMAYLENNRKIEAIRELSFAVKNKGQTFKGKDKAITQLAALNN